MGGRDIGTERWKGRDREGRRERDGEAKLEGTRKGRRHTPMQGHVHTHTHTTHTHNTHTHTTHTHTRTPPSTDPPTQTERQTKRVGDPDPEVSPPGAQSRELGWWRLGRVGNTS